jgi:hypothetical protein
MDSGAFTDEQPRAEPELNLRGPNQAKSNK